MTRGVCWPMARPPAWFSELMVPLARLPAKMMMSENRETSAAVMDDASMMDMDRTACYRAISTPRCPLRRSAVRGRQNHRHLLPADLPGAHPEVRECVVLSLRRGGPGGRLSPLPAVPAGNLAGSRVLARHHQHGVPRARADRSRRSR